MSKTRAALGFRIALIGMFLNLALFLVKLAVGLISGSIAVITDAVNNLLDATSSLLAVIGFRFAEKRRDATHPHGHGRTEYLVGFVISLTICLTALIFGYFSIEHIIHPEPLDTNLPFVIIIIITVLGKLGMSYFYHHFNRRLDSTIFHAASRDALSDALATSTTVLALALAPVTDFPVDGVACLVIALFVFYIGFRTMVDNVNLLIGMQLADKDLTAIKEYIVTRPSFLAVTDLEYHDYGPTHRDLIIKVDLNSKSRPRTIERDISSAQSHLARKYHISATLYWPPAP
jgi:cation diffusion facilitator family transporter